MTDEDSDSVAAPDYNLSDEERNRFDEAFEAHKRGEISLNEVVDRAFPDTTDSEPAEPGDRVDNVRACYECGQEHDDLRLHTVVEEYDVVVSRGRRHPQTGEYMNVETRTEYESHLLPHCPTCRDSE